MTPHKSACIDNSMQRACAQNKKGALRPPCIDLVKAKNVLLLNAEVQPRKHGKTTTGIAAKRAGRAAGI